MSRSHLKWYAVAAVVVLGPVSARMLLWQRTRPQPVDRTMAKAGAELFNHTWEVADRHSPNGDGLGPVFNARSCIACHHQGGVGGGGGLEHNVTTYVISSGKEETPREGVLHADATDDKYRETLALLDPKLPPLSRVTLQQIGVRPGRNLDGDARHFDNRGDGELDIPSHIQLSQRNTPALFGVNLIDAIPEQALLANARSQRLRHAGGAERATLPVGRVHRLPDGRIGRFGWKAQTAHLAEFVQAACANELGLGNPGKEQPVSLANATYRASGLDLSQEQCDQLTEFVAGLERPVERVPAASGEREQAHAGKGLFSKIGCAECHTPALGSIDGIYSDLLLHRMGSSLNGAGRGYSAEPVAPRPDSSDSGPPLADEWRTPPLWGVADSAPYMHDGRAPTLQDAIALHDGQAADARRRFERLDAAKQAQLIAFLKTLRAPQ